MRVSAKVDYALRALASCAVAAAGPGEGRAARDGAGDPAQVPREHPARAAPRPDRRSQRGAEGGYRLARPADRDQPRRRDPGGRRADRDRARQPARRTPSYTGAAAGLRDVWIELRTSMRGVLEQTSLADLVARAETDWRTPARGSGGRRRSARRSSSSSSQLVARQLRPELSPSRAHQLDPHLEAEVDDPLDHRLDRPRRRLGQEVEVVRPHPGRRRARLTGPTKLITNSVAGLLVELARRRRPARSGRGS